MKTFPSTIGGWFDQPREKRHESSAQQERADSDEEAAILAELEGKTDALPIAEREGGSALDRREPAFARRSRDPTPHGRSRVDVAFRLR